jgi:hypothetical protein
LPATSWAVVLWRNHLAEASPRTRALTVHMVCWALVGVCLFDGLGLAYGGDAVARTSSCPSPPVTTRAGGRRA